MDFEIQNYNGEEIIEEENTTGYAKRITFSQETLDKIKSLKLRAANPTNNIFSGLANLVKRNKINIYDYREKNVLGWLETLQES